MRISGEAKVLAKTLSENCSPSAKKLLFMAGIQIQAAFDQQREACAKIAESTIPDAYGHSVTHIASAIRATIESEE